MRKISDLLIGRLNNINFKSKMILIYCVCILIPMLILNLFYFKSVKMRLEEQCRLDMENSVKAMNDSVQNYLTQSVLLINRLTLDETIYRELSYQYTGYKDRMNAMNRLNSLVRYSVPEVQLENAVIYSENTTIPGGMGVRCLDSAIYELQWYKQYMQAGTDVAVIAYADEGRNSTISVVGEATTYPQYNSRWIVKQDLNAQFLNSIFEAHSNVDSVFLLRQNGEIISSYSTQNENLLISDYDGANGRRFLSAQAEVPMTKGWRIVAYVDPARVDIMHRGGMSSLILLIAINIIFATVFIFFITGSLVSRLKALEMCMKEMSKGEFVPIEGDNYGSDEIGVLIKGVNNAVRMIGSLVEDVYQAGMRELEIENEKRRTELSALQSQVNPHFIYNVLESIRMKSVVKNEKETATMIKYVSKLFRRSINQKDDLITVAEELEVIKEYAKIEIYRFGDDLNISIEADDEVLTVMIPKMTLQILLENACVHGVERISGEKNIYIEIKGSDEEICCKVQDNGNGMLQEEIDAILTGHKPKSAGIGLQNLQRRMSLYYGGSYVFNIENRQAGGLEVNLRIPREPKK